MRTLLMLVTGDLCPGFAQFASWLFRVAFGFLALQGLCPCLFRKIIMFRTVILVVAICLLSVPLLGQEVPVGFEVLGTTIPLAAESIPIPPGFTEQMPVTNMVLPALTPEETARGYLTFTTSYLVAVYPYTRPAREEITDQVSMSSVAGEYEGAVFGIHALSAMDDVSVSVSDLVGDANSIASMNTDVRTVRCMRRRVWGQPKYVLRPTLMEKRPTVDIDQDRTQQYWLTVYVPSQTPAGTYSGTITISSTGNPDYMMDVTVEVLGIELLDAGALHGMYYNPRDITSPPEQPTLSSDILRADMLNMREHGMNTFFISIPPTCEAQIEWGQITFDVSPLDTVRDECLDAGFGTVGFNMTLSELIENPLGGFSTMVRAYVLALQAAGWPTIISTIGDEADVNGTFAAAYGWLGQFKSVLPEELNYTTIVFPENSEVFEPVLDCRSFSSYIDETAKVNTRAAGRQLWEYSGAAGYGLDPKGDRFYRGIWSVLFGFDGVLQWTYFRPVIDPTQPFNDLIPETNRNNMTCWVFPGEGGPLCSPGWEAMREGIEDQRYAVTLEALIAEAELYPDHAYLTSLAQQAQAFLDGVYGQVDLSPRVDDSEFVITREVNTLDIDYFDYFRSEAGEHIALLSDVLTASEPTTCQEVWNIGAHLKTDLNQDCRVNLLDVAILCHSWMRCNDPQDYRCE